MVVGMTGEVELFHSLSSHYLGLSLPIHSVVEGGRN